MSGFVLRDLNSCHRNKQVIVTSDRLPEQIKTVDIRLSSRLSQTGPIDIQMPGFEDKCAILRAKAEYLGAEIEPEAIEYIAENINTNIRDLEGEFSKRTSNNDDNVNFPYYLIITDNYRKIEGLKIISDILNADRNYGFSLLCISNNLHELPSKCKTFITLEGKAGNVFKREDSKNEEEKFNFNNENVFFFDKIIKTISNIPIKYKVTEKNSLPDYYTFLEMYNVGLIEQLNILDRWNNNDSTISLAAPLGVKPSGKILSLDVHEKFHGPHGLIAGSTGAGKTRRLLIPSLCNYLLANESVICTDPKGEIKVWKIY